jgi:5'-3' exonuclease
MKNGESSVGVLYGLLKSILDVSEVVYPNHIFFAWDSMKSRRKLIYSLYKHKDEVDMSEEKLLQKQITQHQLDLLRYDILPAIGFNNHFSHTGYEADDVMASIPLQYKFDLFIIVSNDNDMLQCINDNVLVYNHKEHALIDVDIFFNMHGVLPSQWAKVKSISGCSSDKVPGILGVQETKAVQYLTGTMNKKGVIYKRIIDALKTEEYKRDTILVTLPLKQLNFDIQKDNPSIKKLSAICKENGLYKLIRLQELNKWKLIFNNIQ